MYEYKINFTDLKNVVECFLFVAAADVDDDGIVMHKFFLLKEDLLKQFKMIFILICKYEDDILNI